MYDKAELEVLVTDQRENLARKRKEGKEREPPSKKRKFGHNVISRFSYKSRKEEDKDSSKSEAEEFKVTVATNVKRNIVSSAEVITRNSFKGKPNDKEVQEPTTNAKVANNANV